MALVTHNALGYISSTEYMTKLASHTGCAVCLRNDSGP